MFNLRCHYCGKRSNHARGTLQFQCTNCDATNYFDASGNIVDTPADVVQQPTYAVNPNPNRPPQAIPRRVDEDVFCNRCRLNQQIYTEALSNYLPDESHPRYAEFEAGLPQAKAELEKKYPLVCTKCASKAQQKIRHADYFGKTQETARMMAGTRHNRRATSRDDWGKWSMRLLLTVLGLAVQASLLAQMAWHGYGMVAAAMRQPTLYDDAILDDSDFGQDLHFRQCLQPAQFFRFDDNCYYAFAKSIPKSLLISMCLLWYNPAIKSWYHPTFRIEAVHGQAQYVSIQVILLAVRALAWFTLSYRTTSNFSKDHLLAAHGFVIASAIICQSLSLRSLSTDRWTLKGKIMPHPEEVDLFTATAGPAEESYERQASSVHPSLRLFPPNERSFPIENLAPKPQTRHSARLGYSSTIPPSPPISESDEDAMDIDTSTPGNSTRTRGAYNLGGTAAAAQGWNAVRGSLFGIDDATRAAQETARREAENRAKLRFQPPVEQSPFRGHLPQAPMSMERRLRNPPSQFSFKKAPLSKQQNFMQQMRDGIDQGRGFGRPATGTPAAKAKNAYANGFALSLEDDEDFSPVKSRMKASESPSIDSMVDGFTPAKARTKGSLDLRPGSWTLKSDLIAATGLEDMFGGQAFSIANETAPAAYVREGLVEVKQDAILSARMLVLGGLFAAAGMVVAIQPLRRMVCLWLVGLLEQVGY